MVRERIKVEDFDIISKKYEYYLWHFASNNDKVGRPSMRPLYIKEESMYQFPNRLVELLEVFDVPYFESDIEDSLDFLDLLGVPIQKMWDKKFNYFNPFMITFNKRRLVNATYNGFCFCPEGITRLLIDLNPKIVMNAKLD